MQAVPCSTPKPCGGAADELADAPIALLKPVAWSPGTKLGVLLRRGYVVVSVVLLVVKAVQLGGG